MKTFVAALFAVLAVGLAMTWWRQERLSGELQAEIAGLRNEFKTMRAQPDATGERATTPPRALAVEMPSPDQFERMSEEMVVLRKSVQKLAEAARPVPPANPTAAIPNNLISVTAWKNAGRATPAAAVETALWAASGGDVDTVASMVAFTDSARVKADVWFASLSEGVRRQYEAPEKLIALMIAKDAEALAGMQILGQRELNADEVGIRLRFSNAEGNTKDDSLMLRRAAEGWRLVVSDNMVEKTSQKLSGRK